MWPTILSIIWDPAAARAAMLACAAFAAAYFATPSERPWYERAAVAGGACTTVGLASFPSGRSKDLQAQLEELQKRLDAISGPKP